MTLVAVALFLLAHLAPGVGLVMSDEPPFDGILGLACSQELFGDVEDNVQHWCPEDNVIVIYPDAREDPRLFLNVIVHEAYHMRHGATHGETAYERFQERKAYEAGCRFSWHHYCSAWLGGQ